MPIYEFHCAQCGQDSEVPVRTTHWEGTKCPQCGSKKLAKKLSVFASNTPAASTGTDSACATNSGGGCGCCRAGVKHSH